MKNINMIMSVNLPMTLVVLVIGLSSCKQSKTLNEREESKGSMNTNRKDIEPESLQKFLESDRLSQAKNVQPIGQSESSDSIAVSNESNATTRKNNDDDDVSNSNLDNPNNETSDAEVNSNGDENTASASAGDEYLPSHNDKTYVKYRSKSWNSEKPEPGFWDTNREYDEAVTKVYEAGAKCSFRTKQTQYKSNVPDVISYSDYGCKSATYSCEETQCSTSALQSKNVANFSASKGEQLDCIQIKVSVPAKPATEKKNAVPAKLNITRTITKTWRHPTALRHGRIVYEESYFCSQTIEDGEALTPCVPIEYYDNRGKLKRRTATYSRSEMEIVSQKAGVDSGQRSRFAPHSDWQLDNSALARKHNVDSGVSCSEGGKDTLTVRMSKNVCIKGTSKSLTLTFKNINPVTPSVLENDGSISFDGTTFSLDVDNGCTMSIKANRSEKSLIGEGSCRNSFYNKRSDDPNQYVKSFSFVCDAPEKFDYNLVPEI